MGRAIADVLSGERDPGGRLSVVYPKRLEDSPAMRDYAPVNGVQRYTEGEWYGWRGQARNGVEPLIAFGHGLSYGESSWGAPRVAVDASWPKCEVAVPVSCVSARSVTVVVQCYVRKLGDLNPPRLAGWSKHEVAAATHREVVVNIPWTAFRRWNPSRRAWHVAGGEWEVLVAASIGPFARLGSTTRPPWVICTSPRSTSRRAAIRAGSINSRQLSPPT
jgi:beta-glucosidase